jgi:hypothetical protein
MKDNNNPKSIMGNPIIGMKNSNNRPKIVNPNQIKFNFVINSNLLSEKKDAKPLDVCILSNAG